jgi:hypothetical protein
MESEHKDYAFKNEISLSIGDVSIDSSASTPSTVTPAAPTPSPRQNLSDDTAPLTKSMADDKKKPEGIDNKAFEASEKPPLTSFGNGHSNGLNETPAKNGQMSDKKLAGMLKGGSKMKTTNRGVWNSSSSLIFSYFPLSLQKP